jgi:NAD(P)-dependent dehydrogenase (short-subunit alcohol dehydrogenase family)
MSATEFSGRVALVTGAGRGIGRAIALGLARHGARVALLARSTEQIDSTAKAIDTLGGGALALTADLGDTDATDRALSQAVAELGPIDILVNNAAVVWPLGPTTTIDPAQWELATQINLLAPVRLTTAVLPGIVERDWGRIVNVSSGIVTDPARMIGGNAYAAIKAALEAHTLNLAAELENTRVTVNVFRPGSVDTAMQGWIRDQDPATIGTELHERFITMHQSGTLLTPEQSAHTLLKHLQTTQNGKIWNAPN